MYRKAVLRKFGGGIASAVLLLAVLSVTAVLALRTHAAVVWLFSAIAGLGLLAVMASLIGYAVKLADIRAHFSDDLETSIDRCTDQTAGKYFFFSDCLIDLTDARKIDYAEIDTVTGWMTRESYRAGHIQKKRGAVVEIRMKNGKTHLFSAFENGMRENAEEVQENYIRFCELLEQFRQEKV